MKKYIFFRVLRAIFSIFAVTSIVYILIFSFVPRGAIFDEDVTYTKLAPRPDQKADYENMVYNNLGYINWLSTKDLTQKVQEKFPNAKADPTEENKAIYEQWANETKKGWKIEQHPVSKTFYAIRNIPIYERVWNFYSNLIKIDTPWAVHDPNNPNLPRYLKFENTPEIGPALVGSGTKYKYLLYFNNKFPFIHQNFVTLNLGISEPTFHSVPVVDVITSGQGKLTLAKTKFPNGKILNSSMNIYSRQYQSPDLATARTKALFGDPYTYTTDNYQDPSMIQNSFVCGIISLFIAYFLAMLLGVYMARFKGKFFDKAGTILVTVLLALPGLAIIYFIRFIGNEFFGLPFSFPVYGASDIRSYILPILILAIMQIAGLVIWLRRYMIDQQNSDYVKFARAKGLSEKQISFKHILRNAIIPIIHGIPGSIIFAIAGSTMTETIFALPGMGKMLPDAILAHNNTMIVGLTFIFTTLSVLSILLGDIVVTLVDPRIKLTGGKNNES